MENKDAICKALAETLKLTRNHQDLDDLYYMVEDNGDEIVRVQWMNGAQRDINDIFTIYKSRIYSDSCRN